MWHFLNVSKPLSINVYWLLLTGFPPMYLTVGVSVCIFFKFFQYLKSSWFSIREAHYILSYFIYGFRTSCFHYWRYDWNLDGINIVLIYLITICVRIHFAISCFSCFSWYILIENEPMSSIIDVIINLAAKFGAFISWGIL